MFSSSNNVLLTYKSKEYDVNIAKKILQKAGEKFLPDITPCMMENDKLMCTCLNISLEKLYNLKNICDPRKLKISYKNETDLMALSKSDISDVQLNTIQEMNRNEIKKEEFIYSSTLAYSRQFITLPTTPLDTCMARICGNNFGNIKELEKDSGKNDSDIFLLLSVRKADEKKSILSEIIVNSKTKLSDLKDIICCPLSSQNPYSQDPLSMTDTDKCTFKSEFPYSFFFINGSVYEYNPLEESSTFGQKLIKFYKKYPEKYPIHFGAISLNNMSNITLDDLNISLGVPYLFCHYYRCEHIIIFKDIRLPKLWEKSVHCLYPPILKPNYNTFLNNYYAYVCKPKIIFCNICKNRLAVCVTRQDLMALDDPFYLCSECFKRLHIDEYGHINGKFQYYSIKF